MSPYLNRSVITVRVLAGSALLVLLTFDECGAITLSLLFLPYGMAWHGDDLHSSATQRMKLEAIDVNACHFMRNNENWRTSVPWEVAHVQVGCRNEALQVAAWQGAKF